MKQKSTCHYCGKLIEGGTVHTVPTNIQILLGIDSVKAWHPACYRKAEVEVEAEAEAKLRSL